MQNKSMRDSDILSPFDCLAPKLQESLRGLLHQQTFASGEHLFSQGAATTSFYIIAEGRVKVTRVTAQGDEIILCVRGPGQFLCPVTTLDGGSQLGRAEALTDTSVLRAERDSLAALCQQHPELLGIVVQSCLWEVRHLVERVELLASQGVQRRLARMLLIYIGRQVQGSSVNEVPLTHQDLGALIGASRESVSRALAQLQREGSVSLTRGRVIILDRERLQSRADEAN